MSLILDGTNGETFPSWTTTTRPASPVVGQMGYNTTIGQFDAYTSGGWVSVATTTSTSNKLTSAQMPTGSVLQVVQGTLPTSSGFSTTSTSDTFTGLTASITPSSTNSKILILLSPAIRATGGQGYVYQKLWRGSVGSGTLIEDGYPIIGGTTTNNDIRAVGAFNYLDSPATTSTVTYNVSLNATYTTTVWMSSTTSPSTLILMEIAG